MPVRKYVYDGDAVLQETDGAGVTLTEYTRTGGGYGDLLSAYDGTSAKYYEPDALGSTDALADQSQAVADRWSYRAFGAATQTAGTDSTPFTWVGRQGYFSDSETGLYLLGSGTRHYDPATAQFLTNDPIALAGADSNLRRYVFNNPVTGTDATGLVTCKDIAEKLKAAIVLFNKCAAARKVSEDMLTIFGRFAPIECDDEGKIQSVAQADPFTGVITIRPSDVSVEVLVGYILFELLNLQDTKFVLQTWADCLAGKLSRSQYIDMRESAEYVNTQIHSQIVASCIAEKSGWDKSCDYLGWRNRSIVDYLEAQKKPRKGESTSHSEVYGHQWDKACAKAWYKKHPWGMQRPDV